MNENINSEALIRINKLLSARGVCSRREADRMVEEGRITVNGKVCAPGTKVRESDDIRIDGKPVREKDRPKIPDDCKSFALDVTDRLSIEELLTAADVCITDYSSLVFEYSLFERPILFFTYDMQEYLDERGFYYPIREMMPGPVCSTTQELTEVLKTPDAEFNLLRVREFKYRFMSGCDGHATGRILEEVVKEGQKRV